jgi:hypothetical protein
LVAGTAGRLIVNASWQEIDGTAGGFKLRLRTKVESLTEPEDAGSDESRKPGPKVKPEELTPVKAGGQAEGRSGRSMVDASRRLAGR